MSSSKKRLKEILRSRETASMAAALASPCRIKGKRRWVRRPTSGRTVYAYVGGNPVYWVDPFGLQAANPAVPLIGRAVSAGGLARCWGSAQALAV